MKRGKSLRKYALATRIRNICKVVEKIPVAPESKKAGPSFRTVSSSPVNPPVACSKSAVIRASTSAETSARPGSTPRRSDRNPGSLSCQIVTVFEIFVTIGASVSRAFGTARTKRLRSVTTWVSK